MKTIEIKEPRDNAEIKAMWQLNHDVFSRELQQHEINPQGILIDKFHDKNIYRIAVDSGNVVGMICAHWQPPFSAAAKFGNQITALIDKKKTGEVRLFAVRPSHRHTATACRLAAAMIHELQLRGIERLIISGISSQKDFYEHAGFRVAGAPVQDGAAIFYPMFADITDLSTKSDATLRHYEPVC